VKVSCAADSIQGREKRRGGGEIEKKRLGKMKWVVMRNIEGEGKERYEAGTLGGAG
jgi:hypothetical protein